MQVDSRAHIARNWGFRRAIRCGRGFYRIVTEYANDGDDDLDIVYKRILNQSSVYLDPFAQEPDWCDGEWAFITNDIPWSRYKREYPDSTLAGYDDIDFSGLGDEGASWINGEGEARTVRVAEYFYVEYPKAEGKRQHASRRIVKHLVINCVEVLEETEWNGRYIPIVSIIADEDVVGAERSWQGIVRPARDAQRSYNVMRSAEMEAIGLAPKAPFIGYEGQFDGHEAKWNSANVRNWAYLEARPVTVDGKSAPLPQRNVQEPAIQAITLSSRQASDDIHATTGIPPVALGQLDPHERSGKAIAALQQVSEQGTAGYLDNLASISMLYEGKVLRDLIPKVYDRPGRIVHAIGADDQRRAVMIGKPFIQQNGRPTAVPPQTTDAKTYDLAKGQYTVSVKVGKSYTTKREQGAQALGELLQAAPELVPLLGDLWVGELDGPSMRQAADRMKKMAEKQGLIQPEGGQDATVPQLQAQLDQAKQMLEMLTKELQAKTQIIETDGVKAQQQIAIEQLKQETEAAKAQLDAQLEFRKLEVQLEIEMAKLGSAQAMARAEQEQQLLHQHAEHAMKREALGVESAQADMDRQSERDAQVADQQFQAEQGDEDRQVAVKTAQSKQASKQ